MTDTANPTSSAQPDPDSSAADAAPPSETPRKRAWGRLRRNRVAMAALGWILLMLMTAAFAPLIAPHDPADFVGGRFEGPSWKHLLGTDDLGRDVFSRLVHGSRATVRAGGQTAAMALAIAVPIGLLTGYLGGKFDLIVQRIVDALNSFPSLVLALALAAVLGPGLNNAIIAITIVFIPGLVRVVRGQALAVREEVYVEASRSAGASLPRMLLSRVLPGVSSPLIISTAILIGNALLAEAALSFLGLGLQPPNPSWGNMLERGFGFVHTEPQLIIAPGLAIASAVLAFNLFGDGLRDALGISEEVTPGGLKRGRLGITTVAERDQTTPRDSADATEESTALLRVRDLTVEFHTVAGPVQVVQDVNLDIEPGEVLGMVGESGSGKSVTSSAIMRLLPTPPARLVRGTVEFDGRDLTKLSFQEMRQVRGNDIAMVFQDPMSSLDPAFTVGSQLIEAIRLHEDVSKTEAVTRSVEMLDRVRIPDAKLRMDDYPHQMSGGMRQRVLIAMALLNQPKLLIADEPTTALDVTVQAQVIEMLKELREEFDMSLLFVTHDMGVIANIADRVAVMYAGQVVENGPVDEIFARPRHPYTEALLASMPQRVGEVDRLPSIKGTVPTPHNFPVGCHFASRCDYATDECREAPIEIIQVGDGHTSRCLKAEALR